MGGTNCNSCSQGGLYFGFGKTTTNVKLYALIKGKQRRVYVDSKGRYYKEQSKKKYLKKGVRTYKLSPGKKVKKPIKKSPIRKIKRSPKKVPKGYYLKKKVKSPFRKVVKNKRDKSIGTRLSERAVFNDMEMKAVGMSFPVLQKDGTMKRKILRLRKNGSPYFANNFGMSSDPTQLNISTNKNWLRGPVFDNMTGFKKSWPNSGYDIPPGGVVRPFRTSLLPRVSSKARGGNNFGNVMNVPHMHFGKMCFGA